MIKVYLQSTSAIAFLIYAASAQIAYAQTSAAPAASPVAASGVEDIVVTAQRREERLQDVPIAITAVNADRLSRTGVSSTADLSLVTPALTVASNQNYFQPRIRGIGTQAFGPGLENPIATYIDGVYIASAPASLLSLSGIERIEVLKGPQGTLFGRNATGGLIQLITLDPKPGLGGNFDVSYGNYKTVTDNAYLTGGSDTVSADLAVHYSHQGDGYGHDFFRDVDVNQLDHEFGIRSKVLIRPTGTTTIRISADYSDSSGSEPTIRSYAGRQPVFGPQTPGGPWDSDNDYPSHNHFRGGGASVRVDQLIDDFKLSSITAYRRSSFDYQLDFDVTRTPAYTITNIQTDKQFSQEFQLASRAGSRVNWLVGGYYFYGNGGFNPADVGFAGPLLSPLSPTYPLQQIAFDGNQTTRSYSGFGQVTVPLGNSTHITGGLRYTREKRGLNVTETAFLLNGLAIPTATDKSKDFSKLTWRLTLDHKLSSSILAYASYNRGFKSGGFNVTTPEQPQYAPETLDAYEVGLKADLFNRLIRFNPSFFYYNYKNIQVQFYTPQGQIGIQNGPKATIYGGDLDFEIVPSRNFRFYGGATLLHDRFGHYPDAPFAIPLPAGGNDLTVGDATGNRLPFTATFTGTIGAEYTVPLARGSLSVNANLNHNSGFFSETDNKLHQGAYNMVSASIGWAMSDGRLTLRAWAKNLANEAVVTQLSSGPAAVGAVYQPPRTYGVTLGSKF